MTDIVERLRKLQDEPRCLTHSELQEIIDELERLRAALQKIAYPEWGEYPSDEMIVKAVLRIARADWSRQADKGHDPQARHFAKDGIWPVGGLSFRSVAGRDHVRRSVPRRSRRRHGAAADAHGIQSPRPPLLLSRRLSTARWSARRDRCAWVKSSKGVRGSSRLSWSSCRCNQRQGT